MANFVSAFGFEVYFVPLKSTAVDTSSVTGGVQADAAGFIDITSVTATDAVVTAGAAAGEINVGGVDVVAGAATAFKLEGLTDASLATDTSSEEVVTYSDSSGYSQSVATSKSWSISLSGVTDFNDAGYQAMRLAEKDNVAGNLRIKIGRTTPSGEEVFGYATLQSFSESVEAGSIVSFTVEAAGYGPLGLGLAS